MPTLHIEHPVTDFASWKVAFDGLADVRTKAGVRHHHIRRPVDDPDYIVIDLDFDTVREAEIFLEFLQGKVWASRQSSPALNGTPQTRILETAETR